MKTSLAIVLAVATLTIGTATSDFDFEHCPRGQWWTRQVVRGARVPTEADTVRNASWAVSTIGLPVGLSIGEALAGSPSIMEVRDAATDNELDER